MPRPLIIGNGQLLITFDAGLNMRDLYFPYVGMLNHICGHRNRTGVWAEGRFSWLDGAEWERSLGYEADTLVSRSRARRADWGLELAVGDAVHFRRNVYLKRVQVTSDAGAPREVRLFFNHDFCIDETDIGDTALYDASGDCIVHYKRDKCFLIAGQVVAAGGEPQGLFQYATGTKRFNGAEGTWRDAEDGWLEGNPIAQGSVDSTVSFRTELSPGGSATLHYWVTIGSSFDEVHRLHELVRGAGVEALLTETRAYWRAWVTKIERDFGDLPPDLVALFKRSLLTVRAHVDRGGAILAASDSDILHFNRDHYSYVWPRDGALAARALDASGYPELTREFYRFCARGLAPGGFLWHKYNPDGSVGSTWHPWTRNGATQLPIQEDETALVLFALWHFFQRERDLSLVEQLYEPLIKAAADFLVAYRDPVTHLPRDSFDLWEERRGVFTFTACAVWAGLTAAARFAALFGDEAVAERYRRAAGETQEAILSHLFDPELGRFIRGFVLRPDGELVRDTNLESSLAGVFLFGVLPADDRRVKATMQAVEDGLWVRTPVGGLARYARDYYFHKSGDFGRIPGNPWILCTLWLAQWYAAKATSRQGLARAREILEWAGAHALESGILPEQLHPETGEPLSVAPLTWSHATFVQAVNDYLRRLEQMEQRRVMAQAWHAAP